MRHYLCSVVVVGFLSSSCSGGAEASSSSGVQPAQSVATLEAAGSIPILDRTTSIAGTDANANGVRDDVEIWINKQPVTAPQKKALTQHAKALQAEITADPTDPAAVTETGLATMRSVHCIFSRFTGATASRMTEDLKRITFNTKARFIAAAKMSSAASGTVISRPHGDTCD